MKSSSLSVHWTKWWPYLSCPVCQLQPSQRPFSSWDTLLALHWSYPPRESTGGSRCLLAHWLSFCLGSAGRSLEGKKKEPRSVTRNQKVANWQILGQGCEKGSKIKPLQFNLNFLLHFKGNWKQICQNDSYFCTKVLCLVKFDQLKQHGHLCSTDSCVRNRHPLYLRICS